MRYRNLGSAGLVISEVVLGAVTFGELIELDEAKSIVDAAWDQGINVIDTADSYAGGHSEELVGRALAGRRDKFVVFSKVGFGVGDSMEERVALFSGGDVDHERRLRAGKTPNDYGLSRRHITSAIEGTLRRLDTDYIDLYQVHFWDPRTPIEETLSALEDAQRAGKIRYVGCSNFTAWQLYRGLWTAEVKQLPRFSSIQTQLSLLAPDAATDLLPAAAAEGVGVLAYGVLGAGLLSGAYSRGEPPAGSRLAQRPVNRDQVWSDRNFRLVDKLRALAAEAGRTPTALALGWVLAQPGVSAALVGAERSSQITEIGGFVRDPLTAEELAAVDAIRRTG